MFLLWRTLGPGPKTMVYESEAIDFLRREDFVMTPCSTLISKSQTKLFAVLGTIPLRGAGYGKCPLVQSPVTTSFPMDLLRSQRIPRHEISASNQSGLKSLCFDQRSSLRLVAFARKRMERVWSGHTVFKSSTSCGFHGTSAWLVGSQNRPLLCLVLSHF